MNLAVIRNNIWERLSKLYPGYFLWKKINDTQWSLFYTHTYNRNDYGGIPDDSWDEFVDNNFKCECVTISQSLIDDLSTYKGVDVEEVTQRYAEFSIQQKIRL